MSAAVSAAAVWSSSKSSSSTLDAAVEAAQTSTVKDAVGLVAGVSLVLTSSLYLGYAETAGTALVCVAIFGPLVVYSGLRAIGVGDEARLILRAGLAGTLLGLYSWSLSEVGSSGSVFGAATTLLATVALGVQ